MINELSYDDLKYIESIADVISIMRPFHETASEARGCPDPDRYAEESGSHLTMYQINADQLDLLRTVAYNLGDFSRPDRRERLSSQDDILDLIREIEAVEVPEPVPAKITLREWNEAGSRVGGSGATVVPPVELTSSESMPSTPTPTTAAKPSPAGSPNPHAAVITTTPAATASVPLTSAPAKGSHGK